MMQMDVKHAIVCLRDLHVLPADVVHLDLHKQQLELISMVVQSAITFQQ